MAHNSEVHDLINFLDDIAIKQQNKTKKEEKIEDLQIKMLEEFLKTSKKEKNTLTTEQDEEFSRFFDKYERNNETDEAKEIKHDIFNGIKEKSDKEIPTCSRNVNLPQSLTVNNFRGDIINSEKQYFSYIVDKPKVLTPKLSDENNEDLIDEVLIEKNIENNYRKLNKASLVNKPSTSSNEKVDNFKLNDANSIKEDNIIKNSDDFDKKSNLEKESSNEYEDIMNEIISTNTINCYGIKEIKHNNKTADEHLKLKTKEEKEFIKTLVTKYNISYLEPVKKVDKIFNKRCMLKNDAEKVGLSPGATLYEKAIILPKMIKKLEDRKLEKDKKVERKLILCSGYSNNRHTIDIPPCIDIRKNDEIIDLHNKSMDKMLPKPQKVENSSETNIKKDIVSNNNLLEPPKLVMKDCNKERLIAFEAGRLFRNFIRTGNYFSEKS